MHEINIAGGQSYKGCYDRKLWLQSWITIVATL